jgi:type I restriction enzyme S subunit
VSLNLDKSTWKRVAFGDVVRNVNVSIRDAAAAGIDRVIAMEHLEPGELKISRWGSVADGTTFTRRVRPSQTLFGKRRAYQRKAAFAEVDAICSGDILVFEADPTQLLPRFLPFLVQSDRFYDHALGTSAGSLSPRTNWRDLAAFEFDLPPLDEQQRIADLLWSIEHHRAQVAAESKQVERSARTLFTALLDKASGPTVAAPELIRDMTVGVVVQPTRYYTDDPGGVPALRGLNILPGGFDLEDMVRFRPESAAELQKSTVRTRDVVVVRTGRPGDAAVVTDEVDGFNCIDLIIVRPGEALSPHFLVEYLNSDAGGSQVGRHSAGTAQQHFNVGALKRLELPKLPLELQESIVANVALVRSVCVECAAEELALRDTKVTLSSAIFGGTP